jgi:hypothetical protein
MTTLDEWSKDEAARSRWATFIATEEFRRGVSVMETQAVPFIRVGEEVGVSAQRQAYQAGFHAAIHLFKNLHEVHYKKNQEILPEWDYVIPDGND